MMGSNDGTKKLTEPKSKGWKKAARGALQAAGAVPFAGGLFSAAAGFWSEQEQGRLNEFLKQWIKMLEDELREKQQTIAQIAARLNLQDEEIATRVRSDEYQALVKKAFRDWAGTESQKKQKYVRNILTNAAAASLTSDDVVRLFLDWLHTYSELHFAVIGEIYNNDGITRGQIWDRLGKGRPREDSAEADLYKLLFRDLSTGGVVRQHRDTDYAGNFVKKQHPKRTNRADPRMKSAFDDGDGYELTALGQQFVHYAMNEITPKLEYYDDTQGAESADQEGVDANA
ncbi:hypothetical protein [Paracoccus saliphilus]|uniref:Uncharacterized protein n=1 Tax=Paracoccus saliphilus TaxID=405559 RepID=A0AA46A4V5_9RHOB|nr:hypothetical protein [Paracoccus saliphilus]WCR01383.1 hypothetical protein JHX88_10500 [Paracoccus saliphilus]SIS70228.1 hypothetical protein SAMN05421772_103103 [Paracoccus saliphilus]